MSTNLDFQTIYKEYYSKIHHYLVLVVGANDAMDLTQEVFIRVNESLNDLKSPSKISSWIYKIATNLAKDKLRSSSFKNNKKTDSISELGLEILNNYLSSEKNIKSADKEIIKKEMNCCIKNFVETLPNNYKTVLVLSEFEELKNSEIAEILNITLDTVKIRLNRARTKLKEILNHNCNFYYNDKNVLLCDLKK